MFCGVNRSSLSKLFLLQNFKSIDGMTLILILWFPQISAGPQKPQTFSLLPAPLVAADLKNQVLETRIFFLKKTT